MTTALATQAPAIDANLIARVLLHGDLRQLTPEQKVAYYRSVCDSVGLNPLTRPFDYLVLNNKEILYAKRECTEQLRFIHSVSIDPKTFHREVIEGIYVVTASASLPHGRTDVSTGAVSIEGLKGEARANAMMKAETKAKRRVTLSICGLGMLDETEVDTIPGAVTREPVIQIREAPQASAASAPTSSAPAPPAAPNGGGIGAIIQPHWPATAPAHFTASVQGVPGGCWRWTGALYHGYGRVRIGNDDRAMAHRFAYELVKGAIPTGLQIDHLCKNTWCVNPDHLEAVTAKENVNRGDAPSMQTLRSGVCPNGHPINEENSHIGPDGARDCRVCDRERSKRTYDAKKTATVENRGTSDDGPDLGDDLPPGFVRIARIGPGKGGSRAEITFGNGESFLTWQQDVVRVAQMCYDAGTPVTVTFKTSAAGNTRIETMQALAGDDQAF
jgi:hypothetical protein